MPEPPLKIVLVAAARPNFMKVAPIVREIVARSVTRKARAIEYRLVHTGQHYDSQMSDVFFRELGIAPPDLNLGIGSDSHAVQTANVMTRFEPVCALERPDWVVVVGDVNSTMACTLVCAKMGIKVAHVEAGLRSFDRSMPEEVNRIVTDALADLLLTPSADADENLAREGVPALKVQLVGNIMIDSLLANLRQAHASTVLQRHGLEPGDFVFVTLHRPSNVDNEPELRAIMEALRRISRSLAVLFPMHPRTRKMCSQFEISLEETDVFRIVGPIGYHDSLCLTESARLVITDSGGLQEESTFFRTPCLTLRPNTERPITVAMGSNRLSDVRQICADADRVLAGERRTGQVPPMWDGHAARRVVDAIVGAS